MFDFRGFSKSALLLIAFCVFTFGGLAWADPPSISTQYLPDAIENQDYSIQFRGSNGFYEQVRQRPQDVTLIATGGRAPYTWSEADDLPQGLTLSSSTGRISGSPEETGRFSIDFTVEDADGLKANKTLIMIVHEETSPQEIVYVDLADDAEEPPDGIIQTPYDYRFVAEGGTGVYTWGTDGGTLPEGLTLGEDGTLSGTPTNPGEYEFSVYVKDSGNSVAKYYVRLFGKLEIKNSDSVIILSEGECPIGILGNTYRFNFEAVGGLLPYSWSLTEGQLPAGLTLTAEGAIEGIPEEIGIFTFSVTVIDSTEAPAATSDSKEFVLEINSSSTLPDDNGPIHLDSLPDGTVDLFYVYRFAVTGGMAPFFFILSDGYLPDGLSLDGDTGRISGLPVLPGIYYFSITVGDSTGSRIIRNFSLRIRPTPEMLEVRGRTRHLSFLWNLDGTWASYAIVTNMTDNSSKIRLTMNNTTGEEVGTPYIFDMAPRARVIIPVSSAFFGLDYVSNDPFSLTMESSTYNVHFVGVLVNLTPENANDFLIVNSVLNAQKNETVVASNVDNAYPVTTYVVLHNLDYVPIQVACRAYDDEGNLVNHTIEVIPARGQNIYSASHWYPESKSGWVKFSAKQKALTGTVFYVNNDDNRYTWQSTSMQRRLVSYSFDANSFPVLDDIPDQIGNFGEALEFYVYAYDYDEYSTIRLEVEIKDDPLIDMSRLSISVNPMNSRATDIRNRVKGHVIFNFPYDELYREEEWRNEVLHQELERKRLVGKTVKLIIRAYDDVDNFAEKIVQVQFNRRPYLVRPDVEEATFEMDGIEYPTGKYSYSGTVEPNESVSIELAAVDPDNDRISFRFKKAKDYMIENVEMRDEGFSLRNNVLIFYAPSDPSDGEIFEATVLIDDGRNGSAELHVIFAIVFDKTGGEVNVQSTN